MVGPELDHQSLAASMQQKMTSSKDSHKALSGKQNTMLGISTLGTHYPGVGRMKDLKGDTEVRDIIITGNSCHQEGWDTKGRGWFCDAKGFTAPERVLMMRI